MRQPDSRSTSPSATAAAATSAWLARSDAGLPRQLRFGLYLAFAVVALVTLAQAWTAQTLEQARAADAELLDHVGQQRAQSEELARHALLVADPQRDRAQQLQRLQILHAQSAQDALLFEAAMARQLALQDEVDGQLGPALQRWQAARTPLWQHSRDLVALADRAVTPGAEQAPADPALEAAITGIAGLLQADAATARTAAQALADALRNAAQARGQRQRHVIELWSGGTLVLLLLLAAVAVEPAVRAVRRQLDLLADQADSLQRLAVVAEHTQALVIVSDADDRITWTNAAFTQATGWTAAEALGRAPAELLRTVHGDADTPAQLQSQAALRAGQGLRVEARARTRDGGELWLDCDIQAVHDPAGRLSGFVSVNHDVTARHHMQAELRSHARTDSLTRLPNRTAVLERLQRAIDHGRRHPGYGFAVLFMDFDRFKLINDSHGHAIGDALLHAIAERLALTLRPGDTVARVDSDLSLAARLGGDEFVVVLDGTGEAEPARRIAERLLADLAQPYMVEMHRLQCTVSIGVVVSSALAADADAARVLRDADTAMYEAKRGGRNRCVVFDHSMQERVARTAAVEQDLRRALDPRAALSELFVAYQPVLSLQTGRMVGVEALVRWRHPQRGLVSPVDFIGVAEECGLIEAIDLRVLDQACAQLVQWQAELGAAAPGTVAVNLSRISLGHSGLVDEVRRLLARHDLAPERLWLEVNESDAAKNSTVQDTLRQLKALGVMVALDDFGVGYSSLASLPELNVDVVKIDRSFVSQAETVEYHRVLIEATVRVARTVGIRVVAEGVETAGQAALMAALGCHHVQGYLYSRPLEADALVQWVRQQVDGVCVPAHHPDPNPDADPDPDADPGTRPLALA